MRRLPLLALLIASGASAQPKQGISTMQLDSDHANVTAIIAGVQGRFETVAGALQYDPARPDSSTLLLSLDAGSIQNAAVRGAFDAAHYPELRIASTGAVKAGTMPTTVTIRDVTRPVIFQVSFKPVSKDVIALHAEAHIRTGDFHIGGKNEDIPIVIDAPFNKVESARPLP
jgi:polyisoprenoid-binding protein YceI